MAAAAGLAAERGLGRDRAVSECGAGAAGRGVPGRAAPGERPNGGSGPTRLPLPAGGGCGERGGGLGLERLSGPGRRARSAGLCWPVERRGGSGGSPQPSAAPGGVLLPPLGALQGEPREPPSPGGVLASRSVRPGPHRPPATGCL